MNSCKSASALSFSHVGSGFLTIIIGRHCPFSVCSQGRGGSEGAPRRGRALEAVQDVAEVFRCSARG